MFFPFTTDAPVYHWPYATVSLIVVNVALFFGVVAMGGISQDVSVWVLTYGQLDPTQWLLSAFMHQDPVHLIGNMVFLWVFGLIVEGKLGAPRFLGCYLGIAVVESAVEQLLFLGYSGPPAGSLGASTAIYGIMAMAAVWAPSNHITCFYWFGIIWAGTVDVPVATLCLIYLGLDLVGILLGGASGWLHYGGAVLGFPLAIMLLKSGVVDCEGWDMFNVWKGDPGGRLGKEEEDLQRMQERRQQEEARTSELIDSSHAQLKHYLKEGNGLAALKLLDKMKEQGAEVPLEERELEPLIRQLHQAGKWRDSAPYLARLIELRDGRQADTLRLLLAKICVVELGKPASAIDLLKQVNQKSLEEGERKVFRKIALRAKQLQQEAELELDDDAW